MPASDLPKYPVAARQVSAGDVGRRVTVRRTVPGGFSDTIGVLEAYTAEYVELRRPDGGLFRIALDDVAASRVVRAR